MLDSLSNLEAYSESPPEADLILTRMRIQLALSDIPGIAITGRQLQSVRASSEELLDAVQMLQGEDVALARQLWLRAIDECSLPDTALRFNFAN